MFFQNMKLSLGNLPQDHYSIVIASLIVGVVISVVLFILHGIGLYTMAKNRGMSKKWLAFCPFANLYYIGKLAGDCNVFGQRVKRAGLYTMIAQIVVTVLCGMIIAAEIYLYNACGMPTEIILADNPLYVVLDWENLTGFSAVVERFYLASDFFVIFQLVYEIFLLILLLGLYKKYAPKNYTILGFLSFLMPSARFIVIFALRRRKAIDYEAYMRAKREEYMRQKQQYGGYGNPYGNPYGAPYQPPQPQPKPEDPFEEFVSDKKGAESKTSETDSGADSDGFFD